MRYEKYKQTGIPWLPEVPEGWTWVRLSVLGSLSNGLSKDGGSFGKGYPFVSYGDVYRNTSLPSNVKGLVQSSAAERLSCSVLRGDVLFTRTSESIEAIGFSSTCLSDIQAATFAGFLIRFRPRTGDLLPEYSKYYFRNSRLREFFRLRIPGIITRASLSQNVLRDLPTVLPPLPEQRAIVAYLDDKCGKIDELVAAKEKEVGLLKELKQTVIADAVTRGISHAETAELAEGVSSPRSLRSLRENNRRLVPSGIPWLPLIPEGWEVRRLGAYFTDDVVANKDFKYNRAFKFNYGQLIPKNEIGEPEDYRDVYVKYSVLKEGDIVLNGLNLNYDFISQRVAESPSDGIITSAYLVCRPKAGVFSKYFTFLFKAMDFKKMFHGMGTGIRLTLSFSELKKQMLPVPPLDEQRAIVAYIEEKTAKIDQAVAGLAQQVAALKEYKQRLIADVVTGQMRVA